MSGRMKEDDQKLIEWYEKYRDCADLKVLGSLMFQMKKLGWNVHSIYDGEYHYAFPSKRFSKMIACNLDDYSIRFQKSRGTKWHGVLIINGQFPDTISDWNYSRGDADGFSKDMEIVWNKIHEVGK